MHRFFIEKEQIRAENIKIVGEDAHYFSNVLRLDLGEKILVFDGEGSEYLAEVFQKDEEELLAKILKTSRRTKDTKVEITLYQGIAKGDKMDLIVQKCTELGVHRIVPISTERTIVKLNEKKKSQRKERWQKIAKEASKQSRRLIVPELLDVLSFKEALENLEDDAETIIFWEDEEGQGLKEYLGKNRDLKKINIFIGPEGGFSEQEVGLVKSKGAASLSLGRRILRTETAGMASITMILYDLGDLG